MKEIKFKRSQRHNVLIGLRAKSKLMILSAALTVSLSVGAHAQTLYWGGGTTNISDGTAVAGGNGTWAASTTNWASDTSGTTYGAWLNGDVASFGGTAGTVTIGSDSSPTVGGMSFTTTGATWTLAGNRSLSFSSGATVDVGSNTVNFNGALLAGSNGFTKVGTGALYLWSSTTDFTGTITHGSGTLGIRSANAAGNAGSINVTGGTTLQFVNGANTTYGSATPLAVTVNDNASTLVVNVVRGSGSATGSVSTLGALSLGSRTVQFTQASYTTASFAFGTTTLSGASTLSISSGMGVTLGAVTQTGGARTLTMQGPGTLTISGVSSYTGNTVIGATGTFNLSTTGSLDFVIGANGVNNKVTGAGTSLFDGSFVFDLSGADTAVGDSWVIVDTTSKTFNSSFSVSGFIDNGDNTWSILYGGVDYTFSEATGILTTAVPEPGATALLTLALCVIGVVIHRKQPSMDV